MTVEEARIKFSKRADGYVSCAYCPLAERPDYCFPVSGRIRDGYEICWTMIANYLNGKEPDPANGENDVVNHPAHYTQGDIECIDAMKAAFGADELAVYCKIAAFKYVWRCEHKGGIEDIKKAVWYLDKHLELKGVNTDDDAMSACAETS